MPRPPPFSLSLLPKACLATENPRVICENPRKIIGPQLQGISNRTEPCIDLLQSHAAAGAGPRRAPLSRPRPPSRPRCCGPRRKDRDILVSAQTGSGKTVAFGLAMASDLMGAGEMMPQNSGVPLGLVIAPTRELALQVAHELRWLYDHTGARIAACVGGMDQRTSSAARFSRARRSWSARRAGLRDHIERRALRRLAPRGRRARRGRRNARHGLSRGPRIHPRRRRRKTVAPCCFPRPCRKASSALAKKYQRNALRIEVTGDVRPAMPISNIAPCGSSRRKPRRRSSTCCASTTRRPPSSSATPARPRCAICRPPCRSAAFPPPCCPANLSQHERNLSMQALRDGRARVCVATDVAARGLDLPSLGLVIHAELPHDAEALQHRSGRTGRAGRKGVSVLLVPHKSRRRAESLIAGAKVEVEWAGPAQRRGNPPARPPPRCCRTASQRGADRRRQ